MVEHISTTEVDAFIPSGHIQTSQVKRDNTVEKTDYICIKSDYPMTIGRLNVSLGHSSPNESGKVALCWIDDESKLFFLKHKRTATLDTTDTPYDMSQIQQALLSRSKNQTLHTESIISIQPDDDLDIYCSNGNSSEDIHAALDCIADLEFNGVISPSTAGAHSIRSNMIVGDSSKTLTTSGVRIDDMAVLIYDYPLKKSVFENLFLNHEFTHSLASASGSDHLDLIVIACGPDELPDNEIGERIIRNTTTVLNALIAS